THVGGAQSFVAFEQQSGADEQHDGQSDFERKQHFAQSGRRAAPTRRTRCLMKRAQNTLVAAAEGGDESGKHSAQHDHGDRKRRYHSVDVYGFNAAKVLTSSRQPMEGGEGEQKSERA